MDRAQPQGVRMVWHKLLVSMEAENDRARAGSGSPAPHTDDWPPSPLVAFVLAALPQQYPEGPAEA